MSLRMLPLCEVSGWWAARLIAANLGAAGFLWDLKGSMNAITPWATVTVLVPEDELGDAQAYLAAAPVD